LDGAGVSAGSYELPSSKTVTAPLVPTGRSSNVASLFAQRLTHVSNAPLGDLLPEMPLSLEVSPGLGWPRCVRRNGGSGAGGSAREFHSGGSSGGTDEQFHYSLSMCNREDVGYGHEPGYCRYLTSSICVLNLIIPLYLLGRQWLDGAIEQVLFEC
jgi:hypothetical protein